MTTDIKNRLFHSEKIDILLNNSVCVSIRTGSKRVPFCTVRSVVISFCQLHFPYPASAKFDHLLITTLQVFTRRNDSALENTSSEWFLEEVIPYLASQIHRLVMSLKRASHSIHDVQVLRIPPPPWVVLRFSPSPSSVCGYRCF